MLTNINSLASLHALVTDLNQEDHSNKIKVNCLHIGEISGKPPDAIISSTVSRVTTEDLGYTTTLGNQNLRNLIADDLNKRKGFAIGAKNIMITNGSKQGLFYAIQMLIQSGDEVIIHTPYWNSYQSLVQMNGGKIISLALENNGNLNLELLKRKLNGKTKMIIICSPHNPTGSYPDKDNLLELFRLLNDHNLENADTNKNKISILSDEIYERIDFLGEHQSLEALATKHSYQIDILTVGGFSKSHMMTGYRIGYLIANDKLIEEAKLLQANICTCACSLSQYVAIDAIQDRGIVTNLTSWLLDRLHILKDIFQDYPKWEVKGAFYLFVDISKKLNQETGLKNDIDICELLLKRKVAVAPGSFFKMKNHLRISYACSEEMFSKSLTILIEIFKN